MPVHRQHIRYSTGHRAQQPIRGGQQCLMVAHNGREAAIPQFRCVVEETHRSGALNENDHRCSGGPFQITVPSHCFRFVGDLWMTFRWIFWFERDVNKRSDNDEIHQAHLDGSMPKMIWQGYADIDELSVGDSGKYIYL